MFIFNTDIKKEYLKGRSTRYIAEIVGVTESYLSRIFNARISIPKVTAYAITKAGNENAEIQDYFIRKGE